MSQLRVDALRSESGTGAVDFPNGITITGVVTATSISQSIAGDLTVSNNFNALGVSTFSSLGTLTVTNDGTVGGSLTVTGAAVAGTAVVGSAISMSTGALDGGATVRILGESLNIAGVATGLGLKLSGVATATDFNATSDVTLKQDVSIIDNALNMIEQLEGVSWRWKGSLIPSLGVTAQNVETVAPELVKTGDHKTVNYNGLIGVLIQAVKELKAEVDNLKK